MDIIIKVIVSTTILVTPFIFSTWSDLWNGHSTKDDERSNCSRRKRNDTVEQRSLSKNSLAFKELARNVFFISTLLRTMTLTSWTLQRQTLTRKVRRSGWRNKFSEIQAKTKKNKRVSMFRRELAHFDAVMREEFSKTFDRSLKAFSILLAKKQPVVLIVLIEWQYFS